MFAAELVDVAAWIGWAGVAVAALVLLTQAVGWSRTGLLGILQALNVQFTAALALVGIAAGLADRPALGTAATVLAAVAWVTVVRAVRPRGAPAAPPDRPTVTLGSVNLLYSNERIDEVGDVLASLDADLLYLTELTPEFAEVLESHGVRGRYPHRVEDVLPKGSGSALWSRLPLRQVTAPETSRAPVGAEVEAPPGRMTVIGVHPHTPVESAVKWRDGLRAIEAMVRGSDGPLVVIGDFNATYYHPGFVALYDHGLTDAHVETGRGLSPSWPTDSLLPPYLRLDHALTGRGLAVASVTDVDVPGSDHTGLLLSVTTVP